MDCDCAEVSFERMKNILNKNFKKDTNSILSELYYFEGQSNERFDQVCFILEDGIENSNINLLKNLDLINEIKLHILKLREFTDLKNLEFKTLENHYEKTKSFPQISNWVLYIPKCLNIYMNYFFHYFLLSELIKGNSKIIEINFHIFEDDKCLVELYSFVLNILFSSYLDKVPGKEVLLSHETFVTYEEVKSIQKDNIPHKIEVFTLELLDERTFFGYWANVTNGPTEKAKCHVISKASKTSLLNLDQIKKEIIACKLLKHKNVLIMKHFIERPLFYYLFWPSTEGKSLKDLINKYGKIIEEAARPILRHAFLGLQYIHSKGIIHGHLNLNSLVFYQNKIQISNFMLVDFIDQNNHINKFNFISPYSSPESLNENIKFDGVISDIWSLGVILYEICSGKLPFNGINNKKLIKSIKQCLLTYPTIFSSNLIKLLKGIFNPIPYERLSIEQILSHPWFKQTQEVPVSITFNNEFNNYLKKK